MRLPFPVTAAVVLLSSAADLLAQREEGPRFRIGFGVAAGRFQFEEDGSPADDETDAALVRVHVEVVAPSRFGGGVRLEALGTDDDLFANAGFNATEARQGSLFAHFTYFAESHRFVMPVRVGVWLDGLTLEEDNTGAEIDYGTGGIRFEVAPEVLLVRRRGFAWSLFGEFGAGVGGTTIDVDGDRNEYESSTGFLGLEAGTRLRVGPAEIGLSYLGRWQGMDESDEERNLVVLGYDARFQGALLTIAVVF